MSTVGKAKAASRDLEAKSFIASRFIESDYEA
jgi:hypothetical protein